MYSSVTAPRSSNGGVPRASNSAFIQPAPTPAIRRPPDRTSTVWNSFAVSMAGRCGATTTDVSSLIRCVHPARNASVAMASKHSPDCAAGWMPVAVYG